MTCVTRPTDRWHSSREYKAACSPQPKGQSYIASRGMGFFACAGHVVAVRVTSEDANDGFKPTCGSIDELSFRTSPDVWGYFSVKSGGGIHEFSDSQVRRVACMAMQFPTSSACHNGNAAHGFFMSALLQFFLGPMLKGLTRNHPDNWVGQGAARSRCTQCTNK